MRLLSLAALSVSLLTSCGDDARTRDPQVAAELTLALISDLSGELEPCGCTHAARGGVDRLSGALRALRAESTPVVFGVSGVVFSPSERDARDPISARRAAQSRQKDEGLASIIASLAPNVLAPDVSDPPELVRTAARAAVLLAPRHADEACAQDVRVVGGVRVGFARLVHGAPNKIPCLRANAELVVAFRAATSEPYDGPLPDLIVESGGVSGATRERTAPIVRPPSRGRALSVVRFARDPQGRFSPTTARVSEQALDERAPRDEQTSAALHRLFASLDPPASPAANEHAPTYVGARTCAACHTAAYVWWSSTPHARAMDTLAKRGRERDLTCVGCHLTGFGRPGGAQPGLHDELQAVGCESCHGPGAAHVNDPRVAPGAAHEAVRRETCLACHDAEHSDAFDFAERRARLLAAGHGRER